MDRRTFFGTVSSLIGLGVLASSGGVAAKKDEWVWHEEGWEFDPVKGWTYYSRVFEAPLPTTLTVKPNG